MMKLVIATRNKHKLEEIRAIFSLGALDLVSALDFPEIPDVVEDGLTFEDNAAKKAATLARATGCWALADDSGLEVDALDGRPGVYSARYAGEPADYAANNRKLLAELQGQSNRKAHFRCVVALADPSGKTRVVQGRCDGVIVDRPRGRAGFGYDPLFVPDGYAETFAEVSSELKNRISHRARALAEAKRAWISLLNPEP